MRDEELVPGCPICNRLQQDRYESLKFSGLTAHYPRDMRRKFQVGDAWETMIHWYLVMVALVIIPIGIFTSLGNGSLGDIICLGTIIGLGVYAAFDLATIPELEKARKR